MHPLDNCLLLSYFSILSEGSKVDEEKRSDHIFPLIIALMGWPKNNLWQNCSEAESWDCLIFKVLPQIGSGCLMWSDRKIAVVAEIYICVSSKGPWTELFSVPSPEMSSCQLITDRTWPRPRQTMLRPSQSKAKSNLRPQKFVRNDKAQQPS